MKTKPTNILGILRLLAPGMEMGDRRPTGFTPGKTPKRRHQGNIMTATERAKRKKARKKARASRKRNRRK